MTRFLLRFVGATVALTVVAVLGILQAGPVLGTWPLPFAFLFGVGCAAVVIGIAFIWADRR